MVDVKPFYPTLPILQNYVQKLIHVNRFFFQNGTNFQNLFHTPISFQYKKSLKILKGLGDTFHPTTSFDQNFLLVI
jgi:hypothetical protein